MFDPLIDELSLHKRHVTKDQFNQWKRNPVTQEFFRDVQIEILRLMDESMPQTQDGSMVATHQREGAKAMAEQMMDWMPTQMEEEDDS